MPPPRLVLHLPTDVAPWSCAALSVVDGALCAAGSEAVPFPSTWAAFPLEDDGEHFTREGLRSFAGALADALAARRSERVHVVTDSTVGHHNYDADGAWTGWGDAAVVDALRARGVAATVDAVCGSGFVARAREGLHFRPRARAAPAGAEVLLVGGWNDVGHPAARLRAAVAGAVSAARGGAGRAARPCAAGAG